MANINDIIKNATPGDWKWWSVGTGSRWDSLYAFGGSAPLLVLDALPVENYETDEAFIRAKDADRIFIATFGPQHIALMHKVASEEYVYERNGECRFCGMDRTEQHHSACEWLALDTYRKERGLDG